MRSRQEVGVRWNRQVMVGSRLEAEENVQVEVGKKLVVVAN